MLKFLLCFSIALAITLIQGCAAGYVKGDLSGYPYKEEYVSYCREGDESKYVIHIKTNSESDYGDHIPGYISIFTLGIIPTYAVSFDETKVSVQLKNKEIYKSEYKSSAHKFYGWAWLFLPSSVDSVSVDEGSGIRIKMAVLQKSALKAIEDLSGKFDISSANACYVENNI